ncbi:hypothetical protein Scep_023644 [Stephania cephalantha]|uniref:Uncharacterized protein n=1 Tax=Stephania cephalantha TaxID=152367 RepID=A0AAP0HXL1_9MAGN
MLRNDENGKSFVPNEDVGSSAISLEIKNMNSHPAIQSCLKNKTNNANGVV